MKRNKWKGTFLFSDWSVLALLLPAFLLASCSKKEEAVVQEEVVRPVKMMTVTSSTDALQRKFPGMVRAAKRADLAFQVEGTLKQLPVDEGREVKEGRLIAQLDQRDFENNLRNAQGQLARVKAALESAQSEYDRILRIQKQDPGAASESMVVKRREAVDQAKAEMESARAAVDVARDKLGYTTLRAPFAGVVSKRYVDNFQEVRAKQAIVSLDDISFLEILVDLPEIVVTSIKESDKQTGSEARAHAEFAAAPGKEYPLKIKEFATRADPRTQTYQVVFQMKRPEGLLILPGMTATVVGKPPVSGEKRGFFIIPTIAVFADDEGNSNVWVVDKEKMTVGRRKVTTGDLTGEAGIQITEGLQSGEMIAASGVSQLREGMKVKAFDGSF
ncbi:MAG: efflux RND transporter periplasmic adaptor subunit [Desulfatiglandaceae bacterium]